MVRTNIAPGDEQTGPGQKPLMPGQVRFGQKNQKVGYRKDDPRHRDPMPETPDEGQAPAPEEERPAIPPELAKHLAEKGYKLIHRKDGSWYVKTPGIGYAPFDDEKMKVLQHLYNKFGITNDTYDASRIAFFQGGVWDLTSGLNIENQQNTPDNYLADEQLDKMRAKTGWTWESAYQGAIERLPAWEREAKIYNSLEDWQASVNASRKAHLEGPKPSESPEGGGSTPGPKGAPSSPATMPYQPAFTQDDIQADYI